MGTFATLLDLLDLLAPSHLLLPSLALLDNALGIFSYLCETNYGDVLALTA